MREKEKAIVGYKSVSISDMIVLPNERIIHDVLLAKSNKIIFRDQNTSQESDQPDSQTNSDD